LKFELFTKRFNDKHIHSLIDSKHEEKHIGISANKEIVYDFQL